MSDQLSELAELGWAQLWQVTVVASLALVVVRLFCRHRPHLAYVLLLVVVVKCLTPPIWSSPVGVFSWSWSAASTSEQSVAATSTVIVRRLLQREERDPNAGALPAVDLQAGDAALAQTNPVSAEIGAYLLLAWACGVVVCVAFVAVTWLKHLREIRKTSTPADEHLATLSRRVAEKVGLKRRVRLLVSSKSYGPSCFGMFFPCVVLPDQLVGQNSKQNLEPVLAHELIHIRRGDTWAALFQILAGIVWWFHPLVWLVTRQLSRARERCCDEEVVAIMACDPEKYAESILHVLKFRRPLWPAFLASGIRPVEVTKERLESIMNSHNKLHSRTPWLCWVVFVLGAMLVVPGAVAISTASADLDENRNSSAGEKEPSTKTNAKMTNLSSLRFGKVVECTVYDDVPGFEFLVDFDRGTVFSPPKDFKPKNGKEAIEWFQRNGVDAMGEGDYLLGIDMVALPTAQSNWNNPQPRVFHQIEDGKPGTPIPISGHGRLPSTYFFKTREGGRGILQVTAFTPSQGREQPQATKVRFKMLVVAQDTDENNRPGVENTKWGTLRGQFVYVGQRPEPKRISVTKDVSAFGKLGLVDESLLVNQEGGIENVLLFPRTVDTPVNPMVGRQLADAVTLENKDGQFTPRILAVWASRQFVRIRNSGPSSINAIYHPFVNSAFNVMLRPGESYEYRPMRGERRPELVSCSIKPWMKAYLVVRDNPYVAISQADGRFSIEHLPVGKLEFQAWHERCGWLTVRNWDKGRFTLTVSPGENDMGTIVVPAKLMEGS